MSAIRHLYIRIRESSKGQTMTEYVLIVAAVAIVAYAGYQTFGTTVSTEVTSINNQL